LGLDSYFALYHVSEGSSNKNITVLTAQIMTTIVTRTAERAFNLPRPYTLAISNYVHVSGGRV